MSDNNAINRRIAVEVMGLCLRNWDAICYLTPDDSPLCNGNCAPKEADFTPSTNLNHAKLAWDKVTIKQKWNVHEIIMKPDYEALGDVWLDPLKLCNAILLAVGGDNGKT